LHRVPELLAPAGGLEKLKLVVSYGASAVYLGGQNFGLRTAAENFTDSELKEGVSFAHRKGVKVFVVLNAFLHDIDLKKLPSYISFLNKIKVDGVIASDLGVIETIKEHSKIPIHLSTQASCLNVQSAKRWEKMGVKRVILGREASLDDALEIKNKTNLEVEMFIHGAMCMAYSGNCVISNYTSGRDSNRGGCAHSCRFNYDLNLKSNQGLSDEKIKSYFMSSKDLAGIKLIKKFLDYGIDSLKIEGRMKGHLYAATVTKAYASVLKTYQKTGEFESEEILLMARELENVGHRNYTDGSLLAPAGGDSIYEDRKQEIADYVTVGLVVDVVPNSYIVAEVKKAFYKNNTLEIIPFKNCVKSFCVSKILNIDESSEYEKTRPGSIVKLPWVSGVEKFNVIRRKVKKEISLNCSSKTEEELSCNS